MSSLEYRQAQVVDVSYPKRMVELVVMPYETETTVAERGRVFVEICSRGAYDGVENRANRIRVNRDHDIRRTCGRAVSLFPSRLEGLIAELRMAATELGDETLALADEGILDASAGFALLRDERTGKVKPDAEVWENRNRRRLNHLYLGHIAMTPDPAYETANVLAVRGNGEQPAAPAQSNLERLEIQQLREQLAAIDARYSQRL